MKNGRMSGKLISEIYVQTQSQYMPERSHPLRSLYFFAYRITIVNESRLRVQLMRRYWRIRDAFGRIEEVEGPGVVGQQPLIKPQESFTYTSFCPLPTEFGSMEGSYLMQDQDGQDFSIPIKTFLLVSPQAAN